MSLLQYLELQPVDIAADGSIMESELNSYGREDDVIDLSSDDGTDLIESWSRIEHDMHE